MTVLIIISFLITGGLLGYLFQAKLRHVKVGKLLTASVYLLLFVLGIYIGANPEIMNNLHNLGWQAFCIAVSGVIGSVLAAWLLWKNKKSES